MKNSSSIKYLVPNYHYNSTFLNSVFLWMGIGLFITSAIAYLVASSPNILSVFVTEQGFTVPGYIVMFAPLALVLLMSFGVNKLSFISLWILFFLYASLMGVSLSFIFLIYTTQSIYLTFGISASMFIGMGLIGYITKTDLSRMGNILLMGLMGIIIASCINLFLHSDTFTFLISFISIIIFCGLTAWDVQKLKTIAEDMNNDSEAKAKLGVLGALTLYMDFINLFLSLLRFFGKKRE